MYRFFEKLYTDVRIEEVSETRILYTLGKLEERIVRRYAGAFVRVFDGTRWYYLATTDIANLQREIDTLASQARPSAAVHSHPAVARLSAERGERMRFSGSDISGVPGERKDSLLRGTFPVLEACPQMKLWRASYTDRREVKRFYSSLGADLSFDNQRGGFTIGMRFADGERKFSESFKNAANSFPELEKKIAGLEAYIARCVEFMNGAEPVVPGTYTVVLSPMAAGVFAHESFGHKSEADFMLGDGAMKREWVIGKKVGSDILSIVDDGTLDGSGYIPFDDEGTPAGKTYLIKNGVLAGRLHSAVTAAALGERPTGNARSIGFEFEPIVRMTTTYIEPGKMSREELLAGVDDGIFIDTIKHGSGLSTFTLAPSLAYRIKGGKIAGPVNISVVSGSVFGTLEKIDGLSDTMELRSFAEGGCGKMDQWPLPVGFGGPLVRVRDMNVQ